MKIGDRVTLKSGGPVMTVAAIQKDERDGPPVTEAIILGKRDPERVKAAEATRETERMIGCVWWNVAGQVYGNQAFPAATLEPAEDKPQDWSQAS